jgi:hypothetical protein
MDSMRNLKTSLPSTSSPRRHTFHPPEQLQKAFKQAALSVTNLYKTAAADQAQAYQDGYQDALEELLNFIDKENIGLQEGEGWRVRQWATERYQGTGAAAPSESEEDAEEEKRARSSSPALQRKPSRDVLRNPPLELQSSTLSAIPSSSPIRSESAPPVAPASVEAPLPVNDHVPQSDFSFRTAHAYPSVHDIEMEVPDDNNSNNNNNSSTPAPTVQVNIIPRSSRNSRHIGHNARSANRSPGAIQLGPGSGMKRRMQTMDFFDFGNFNTKDGSNGGPNKKGRFS